MFDLFLALLLAFGPGVAAGMFFYHKTTMVLALILGLIAWAGSYIDNKYFCPPCEERWFAVGSNVVSAIVTVAVEIKLYG